MEAAFNDKVLQLQPTCHPETRVQLLKLIEDWPTKNPDQIIFWLKGLAGTGKSTIAKTIASTFEEKKLLAGSFFFARGAGDRGNAAKFFITLAFQFSTLSDDLAYAISEAIRTNRDIVNKTYDEQWRYLICQPIENYRLRHPLVVVIDALDECESSQNQQIQHNDPDIQTLLSIVSQAKDIKGCPLRFFITSRPEIPVKYGFSTIPYTIFYDYALHEVEMTLVQNDIKAYLKSELGRIKESFLDIRSDWPGQNAIDRLATNSGKLFIYAATACRFINQGGPKLFKARLADILEDDSDGCEGIDDMYSIILERQNPPCIRDREKERLIDMFQHIVGAIVVLFSPLSVTALNELLSQSDHTTPMVDGEIRSTLLPLGSVLDIPDDDETMIRVFHQSFRDFLLSKERCRKKGKNKGGNQNITDFWIPEEKAHAFLVDCCLGTNLKENICCLESPCTLITDVESSTVISHLPHHVQYACQYWVDHLERLKDLQGHAFNECYYDRVHSFLKKHFLHWLETLSLMGKGALSVRMISQLEVLTVSNAMFTLYGC